MNEPRPFKMAAPVALEWEEQAALFRFAQVEEQRDPRWKMLSANQNGLPASSIQEAARAKKCGMKRGFPDLTFPVPSQGYHGLFIEMKRQNGRHADVSIEQRQWLSDLTEQGYLAVVAFGWEHAALIIHRYLGTAPPGPPSP